MGCEAKVIDASTHDAGQIATGSHGGGSRTGPLVEMAARSERPTNMTAPSATMALTPPMIPRPMKMLSGAAETASSPCIQIASSPFGLICTATLPFTGAVAHPWIPKAVTQVFRVEDDARG